MAFVLANHAKMVLAWWCGPSTTEREGGSEQETECSKRRLLLKCG